jgi:hypothetical protein
VRERREEGGGAGVRERRVGLGGIRKLGIGYLNCNPMLCPHIHCCQETNRHSYEQGAWCRCHEDWRG